MYRKKVNLILQTGRMVTWVVLSIGTTLALGGAWVLSLVSKNQNNRKPYFKVRSIVDVKE
jgi:hypothetical protein